MSIKETSEGTLEAESRSRTLLGTIKNSWSNIAQKLSDIDHTTGPWTPGTHPFNHFKYKIIRRKITFAAATRNCGRLSGSLLHGDIDIAKYIPELEKETKIWYSTKDTRPIMAMKTEDIQDFVNNIGTCYTIENSAPPIIVTAHEEDCNQKHISICTKMLNNRREAYTYTKDVQYMQKQAPKITNEDAALTNTLQRLLQIGNPSEDRHHPASLSQTITLLVSMDQGLNTFAADIPLFPEKDMIMEGIYQNRNLAHTIILMVISQHLENYATKIDTLIKTNLEQTIENVESNQESNSGLNDDFSSNMETNQKLQLVLDIAEAQEDIKLIKTKLETTLGLTEQYKNYMKKTDDIQKKLDITAELVNTNQKKIKTTKDNIKIVNKRLNEWIQEEIKQTTTETMEDEKMETEDIAEGLQLNNTETQTNGTNTIKFPQIVMDFLQNEEYIWIATAITIMFTVIAVINSILTCLYVKTNERRNQAIKKHLQISPKYRKKYAEEENTETESMIDKTRLERIEDKIKKYNIDIAVLQEQMSVVNNYVETQKNQTNQTGNRTRPDTTTKRRSKTNAPTPPKK